MKKILYKDFKLAILDLFSLNHDSYKKSNSIYWNENEESFSYFDQLMNIIDPNISYLKYKEIKSKCVVKDRMTENEILEYDDSGFDLKSIELFYDYSYNLDLENMYEILTQEELEKIIKQPNV